MSLLGNTAGWIRVPLLTHKSIQGILFKLFNGDFLLRWVPVEGQSMGKGRIVLDKATSVPMNTSMNLVMRGVLLEHNEGEGEGEGKGKEARGEIEEGED